MSGPFLWEPRAHYNIAFSCITYLNTSFCFHQADDTSENLRTRVAKGFHGLHHYANEFWFQHLLFCARQLVELDRQGSMQAALKKVLTQFWKGKPGVAADTLKLDDTTTASEI